MHGVAMAITARRRASRKWHARLAIHQIWTVDSRDQTIVNIPIVFSDEATRIRTSRCELRRPGPGRREHDAMSVISHRAPWDAAFRRIEIAVRQRHEQGRHAFCPG